MRKTDADIERERKAREWNEELLGTRISVTGGGRRGPYTITVERLNQLQVPVIIRLLRQALSVDTK